MEKEVTMRMRGQDGVTERKKGERVLRKVTVRMRGQDELTKKGVGSTRSGGSVRVTRQVTVRLKVQTGLTEREKGERSRVRGPVRRQVFFPVYF
jgi:hypothetical protein